MEPWNHETIKSPVVPCQGLRGKQQDFQHEERVLQFHCCHTTEFIHHESRADGRADWFLATVCRQGTSGMHPGVSYVVCPMSSVFLHQNDTIDRRVYRALEPYLSTILSKLGKVVSTYWPPPPGKFLGMFEDAMRSCVAWTIYQPLCLPLLMRVFAILLYCSISYQIILGWKTCTGKCYYDTDELPNPRPTQPKQKYIFSWVGIGFI